MVTFFEIDANFIPPLIDSPRRRRVEAAAGQRSATTGTPSNTIVGMTSNMSEPMRVQQVAKLTMADHRDGITLLRQAANQANTELFMFHRSVTTDRAIQFRLLTITQTVNAA